MPLPAVLGLSEPIDKLNSCSIMATKSLEGGGVVIQTTREGNGVKPVPGQIIFAHYTVSCVLCVVARGQ